MNLYLRLIWMLLAGLGKPRLPDILQPAFLTFRVLPNDLDLNAHMNNGRYMTIMDLGRLDLVLRSGMMGRILRLRCIPVLSAAKIRYRLPLAPFQKYRLETRVLCWDDRWFYIEQRFIIAGGDKKDAVAAAALLKGGFYDRRHKKMADVALLFGAGNAAPASPPFPPAVDAWRKSEDALKNAA